MLEIYIMILYVTLYILKESIIHQIPQSLLRSLAVLFYSIINTILIAFSPLCLDP